MTKRSLYLKATPEQKAAIGRYAAKNKIVNSIRRFQKDFPTDSLKESTVRGWKNVYLQELQSRKQSDCEMEVKTLLRKKTGRPLTLDEETDMEIQKYLLTLHEAGGSVSCAIARAGAMDIITRKNSSLLECNGGSVVLTKDWSRYLLERMHFVKRKANAKAKVSVENFTQLKYNYLSDISRIMDVEEISLKYHCKQVVQLNQLLCSFLSSCVTKINAKQKHLGCKKRRGQSEAAVIK